MKRIIAVFALVLILTLSLTGGVWSRTSPFGNRHPDKQGTGDQPWGGEQDNNDDPTTQSYDGGYRVLTGFIGIDFLQYHIMRIWKGYAGATVTGYQNQNRITKDVRQSNQTETKILTSQKNNRGN